MSAAEVEKNEPGDVELARLSAGGDTKAFEQLYRRHFRRVYALCLRMLGDQTLAEDLTQDVFIQLFNKIGSFRGESAFTTWVHRVTVNACRDVALRRRAWEPLDGDSPGTVPESGAFSAEMRACLLELPPTQAKIVVLKDAFGFSFDEVAAASGVPVGTAKCYAHRARKRLRAALEAA